MNSISYPSLTQSVLHYSSYKPPLISSLPPHLSFKSNQTHLKISPITLPTPNLTTKASAAANSSCIPAPEETLYDLLGISENGTLNEIKHAYKKLALKYHPDVSPPDRAEEYTLKFIRVLEAYETLSDPETRSVYDRCMAKGLRLAFSGKRETRFDPRSDCKNRWRETWQGQISELMRRSRVKPSRGDPARGLSWAARIRKQRSEEWVNGSDHDQ